MDTYEKLKKNGVYLNPEDVEKFCKKHKVSELAVFGSSIRDDFHKDSDVDFLISFVNNFGISLFDVVDMEDELAQMLKREVQIVAKDGLKNPIRRRKILASCEVIYVAS